MTDRTNEEQKEETQVWLFKQNCALTPKQLLYWYLSLAGLTLGIASGFLLMGFWIVLPFAGLELLLVGIAFLIYGRHATDYERIELTRNELKVDVARAQKVYSKLWVPGWTRFEYNGKYKAPFVLKCGKEQIALGRFIPEKDKSALQREIRAALARAS